MVFTRQIKERSKIYINGVEVSEALPLSGDLSNWRPDYTLRLANEAVSSQPWKGLFNLISMYNRALHPAEIQQNFSMGPVGKINIKTPGQSCSSGEYARKS